MQPERLQQAMEMAKKELQILQDPQSKLRPFVMERFQKLQIPAAAAGTFDIQPFPYHGSSSSLIIDDERPEAVRPKRTTPRKPALRPIPTTSLKSSNPTSSSLKAESIKRRPLTPEDLKIKFYQARPLSGTMLFP
jgi:hypothetical protein